MTSSAPRATVRACVVRPRPRPGAPLARAGGMHFFHRNKWKHSHLRGGGSGKIRSTFSDCLSALGVLPRTFDCTIYSQIPSVPVAELGLGELVVVLVCGGRDVW